MALKDFIRPTMQRNVFLVVIAILALARIWVALDTILNNKVLGIPIEYIVIFLVVFLGWKLYKRDI